MTMNCQPEVIDVDRIGNAVIVQFKDEKTPAIYPASFLHSAIGIAAILYEAESGKAKKPIRKALELTSGY